MNWQPIETAPKDGTVFLAWIGKKQNKPIVSACKWIEADFRACGYAWHTWQDGFPTPTHWMPLPEPPA